ncbi:MAG: two pore domain potassium channel family protein [Deltaproteobacteria bacterium]|nr:two pore domain potassium channel family protein [Deltaproteobacteria bacterium]
MPHRPASLRRLPHYGTLLAALLLDIVLAPLLLTLGAGMTVARTIMVLVLLSAFLAVGAGWIAGLGLLVAVAAMLATEVVHNDAALAIELALRILFVGYVILRITREILRQGDVVTADTIAGAACVYMLLGVLWANAYLLLEHLRPGSFAIPAEWRLPGNQVGPALVYFSYATLTTVGYGDIHAAGPAGGGLAIVEAIVGQLFLAITIARLVGQHLSRRA